MADIGVFIRNCAVNISYNHFYYHTIIISFKPGPGGDERLTAEEAASIRYLPCKEWGGQSEEKK